MSKYPNLIEVRSKKNIDGASNPLPSVQLGKPQSLMVVISTGRNHIDKLTIRLVSPSVTFRCQETILLEGKCILVVEYILD